MAPKRRRTEKKAQASSQTYQATPPSAPDPNGPVYFWKPQEKTTGYLSQWYALPFRDRQDPHKVYLTAEHYMMHHKALLFGDDEMAASILEATSPRDVRTLGRAVRGFDAAVWEKERERIVTEGSWCKFSLPVVVRDEDLDTKEGVQEEEEAKELEEGRGRGGGGKRKLQGEKEEQKKDGDDEEGLKTWRLGDGDDAQTIRAASFRDVLLTTGNRELVEASPYDRIWGVGFAAKSAEGRRQKWGTNLLGKCLMEVREQFRKEAEAARLEDGEDAEE
jgi:ribA/ribD-fused uncharacterized protein